MKSKGLHVRILVAVANLPKPKIVVGPVPSVYTQLMVMEK